MGVNHVEYGGRSIIDIRDKTVTPEVLFKGETAKNAAGDDIVGTFTVENEMTEQDALIAQIKSVLAGKAAGSGGGTTPTQEKTVEIAGNGTVEIMPDDGYALSKVTAKVNVPIPNGYIQPSGTKEITENGTHDVTEYASVNVNVEAGDGDPTALLDAILSNTLTAIDSNITSLVAYACRGLSKLKTVNLPQATSIGTYAFYYCTAMNYINAPNATSIGTYALYNCGAIKSVNFPLVTTITQNSFYSCGVLAKADFGVASTINTSAFAYCAKLTTLILRRTSAICTLANKNALTGTPIADGTGYVYVPAALVDSYKAASNWSTYANQIRAIEDYPDICG